MKFFNQFPKLKCSKPLEMHIIIPLISIVIQKFCLGLIIIHKFISIIIGIRKVFMLHTSKVWDKHFKKSI